MVDELNQTSVSSDSNSKVWLWIIIGLIVIILIVGGVFLMESRYSSSGNHLSSSLKEYNTSIYSIKYPSDFVLQEKAVNSDGGSENYTFFYPTENNSITEAFLSVSPRSLKDLIFYEQTTTVPPSPTLKKVTYGTLKGYQSIMESSENIHGVMTPQGSIIVNVFDKENKYWIKYEIDYSPESSQKTSDLAIQITKDILSNFRYRNK